MTTLLQIHWQARNRARQSGMSLVTAIFLVVVLATLAGAIVNVFTSQQQSSALDLEGVRAYQAARAGIEWGVYRKMQQDSCSNVAVSHALPAGTSLSNFTFTVSCTYYRDPGPQFVTQDALVSSITLNQKTVTVANTALLNEGMAIWGAGIEPGAVITSIDSPVQLTMSISATQTLAAVALRYYSTLDRWEIISTACNKPGAGGCPNASNNKDYVQRRMQVRF